MAKKGSYTFRYTEKVIASARPRLVDLGEAGPAAACRPRRTRSEMPPPGSVYAVTRAHHRTQGAKRGAERVKRIPARGRPWLATDRTGGPFDAVLEQLHREHPQLVVERLDVTHPGDDDNVYFLGDEHGLDRVQVDTADHGQPPFMIEATERYETSDPVDAAAVISTWLHNWMQIRPLVAADWAAMWAIIREVVQEQATFPYDPAMTEDQARQTWIETPPGLTVVAVENDKVLGTAKMGTNRPGPGSHVSTASFMVAADARGRGVGSALCRFAVAWAKERGYAGMQFNAVVESNHAAVRLYERHGFSVVGTVPRAFVHPTLGRVGLHVMYNEF
jgi:L-amino acid N-acyltransferase YncA